MHYKNASRKCRSTTEWPLLALYKNIYWSRSFDSAVQHISQLYPITSFYNVRIGAAPSILDVHITHSDDVNIATDTFPLKTWSLLSLPPFHWPFNYTSCLCILTENKIIFVISASVDKHWNNMNISLKYSYAISTLKWMNDWLNK